MATVSVETENGFTEVSAENGSELQRIFEAFLRENGLGRLPSGTRMVVVV